MNKKTFDFTVSCCTEAFKNFFKIRNVRGGAIKNYKNLAPKPHSHFRVKNGDCVQFNFDKPVTANTIILREKLNKKGSIYGLPFEGGVKQFSIYASLNGVENLIYRNDKIDSYRMCTFSEETFDSLKIVFDDCRKNAVIKKIEIYNVGKVKQKLRINDYFVYEENRDYAHDKGFVDYLDTITDLTMFIGAGINRNGEVTYGPDKETFAKRIDEVRAAIGNRDVKLYCTVFSSNETGDFFEGKTKKLAKNLVEFLNEFNLDGVDFDWEFPSNLNDWRIYSDLAVDLHKAFAPYGKKFSFTPAVYNMKFTKAAKEAVDYFNIMVYDLGLKDYNGYHSTFKHHAYAAERLIKTGYAPEKICLGFPYYGRETKGTNAGNYWIDYRISEIKDKWSNFSSNGCRLDKQTGEKVPADTYYNGYAMIRDKTAYAISMGIGGVMTWSMMSDLLVDNELSLHRAVKDACEQRLER